MYCSDRADVHRIYIFFSNKSGNIFYVIILFFFRHDCCDNTCKTASMNTAYTCPDLLEEELSQCKCSGNLLLMKIFHCVAVLKKFP